MDTSQEFESVFIVQLWLKIKGFLELELLAMLASVQVAAMKVERQALVKVGIMCIEKRKSSMCVANHSFQMILVHMVDVMVVTITAARRSLLAHPAKFMLGKKI